MVKPESFVVLDPVPTTVQVSGHHAGPAIDDDSREPMMSPGLTQFTATQIRLNHTARLVSELVLIEREPSGNC